MYVKEKIKAKNYTNVLIHKQSLLGKLKEAFWIAYQRYGYWAILMLFLTPFLTIFRQIDEFDTLKKFFFISIVILLIPMIIFISLIIGEPDRTLAKKLFERHISRVSLEVFDKNRNLIGLLPNDKLKRSEFLDGTLYIDKVPSLYWKALVRREDRHLSFENNSSSLWALLQNLTSFNGLNVLGTIKRIASLQGGGSTLIQQLYKNLIMQKNFSTSLEGKLKRKYDEFRSAKTLYSLIYDMNGTEFKRWIGMYTPSMLASGTNYGLINTASSLFGKKLSDLNNTEQLLLSSMHKYNFSFYSIKQCKKIKSQSLTDANRTLEVAQKELIFSEIKSWVCPTAPKVPYFLTPLVENLKAKDDKIAIRNLANLTTRLGIVAGSTKALLKEEIKNYAKQYPDQLLTEAKLSINLDKNRQFKSDVKETLINIENQNQKKLRVQLSDNKKSPLKNANIWISVVNDKGEYEYIYQSGNVKNRRRIGSLSKILASIGFGYRGDKATMHYCNEYYNGLHNSNGSQGVIDNCSQHYSAKEVFGRSKNLPIRSAMKEYLYKNIRKQKIISRFTWMNIYKAFGLKKETTLSDIKNELAFGMTNASPKKVQEMMHTINYLLEEKRDRYASPHLLRSIKYKKIDEKNLKIKNGGINFNIASDKVSPILKKFFTHNTKKYMLEVLKAPILSKKGTLRSLKYIRGYKPIFMKSGTTDVKQKGSGRTLTQSKWVAGAISVKGKAYTFVIMVHQQAGLGQKLSHFRISQPLFKAIVKSLNRK